jgi:hypothetical protein
MEFRSSKRQPKHEWVLTMHFTHWSVKFARTRRKGRRKIKISIDHGGCRSSARYYKSTIFLNKQKPAKVYEQSNNTTDEIIAFSTNTDKQTTNSTTTTKRGFLSFISVCVFIRNF